jgi:trehalose 2-sulfotransferase
MSDPSVLVGILRESLLRQLSGEPGVVFVARREYVAALARFFGPASRHAFVGAEEPVGDWLPALEGREVVVAAGPEEEALAADVERGLAERGQRPSVYRLLGDLFVNVMSRGPLWRRTRDVQGRPRVAFAIVCTPRSGSEFLCEALRSTGVAGYPREHLRSHTEALARYWQLDPSRYLEVHMAEHATPNGVFGTKLISHFLLDHVRAAPGLERTLAGFRFIRLSRRDAIGQAISAMIASRTGTYHVRDAGEQSVYQNRLRGVAVTDAELRQVGDLQAAFAAQEAELDELLRRMGATPLTIHYEDLIVEPLPHIRAILSFLGVAASIDGISVKVRKTESRLSHVVRRRYLARAGGRV